MLLVGKRTAAGVWFWAAVLAAGITAALWGVWWRDHITTTLGVPLGAVALAAMTLRLIRGWISDTTAERERLRNVAWKAEEERLRYIAAQAALEMERNRVRRDLDDESRRITAQLEAERQKLQEQADDERDALIVQAFEDAYKVIEKHGLPGGPTHARSRGRDVIPFPVPADRARAESASRPRDVSRS